MHKLSENNFRKHKVKVHYKKEFCIKQKSTELKSCYYYSSDI